MNKQLRLAATASNCRVRPCFIIGTCPLADPTPKRPESYFCDLRSRQGFLEQHTGWSSYEALDDFGSAGVSREDCPKSKEMEHPDYFTSPPTLVSTFGSRKRHPPGAGHRALILADNTSTDYSPEERWDRFFDLRLEAVDFRSGPTKIRGRVVECIVEGRQSGSSLVLKIADLYMYVRDLASVSLVLPSTPLPRRIERWMGPVRKKAVDARC